MTEVKIEDTRRVELLSDARVLIAWLEANPDIPVDSIGISYHVPTEDDDRGVAEVHRVAGVMNAPVRRSAGGAHHTASTVIGRTSYQVIYIETQHMADYERRQEIARKLADEEKAAS